MTSDDEESSSINLVGLQPCISESERANAVLEKIKLHFHAILAEIAATKAWAARCRLSSLNYLKSRLLASLDRVSADKFRLQEVKFLQQQMVNKSIKWRESTVPQLLERPEHFSAPRGGGRTSEVLPFPLRGPWEDTEYKHCLISSLHEKLLSKAAFTSWVHYCYAFRTAEKTIQTCVKVQRKQQLQICFKALFLEYLSTKYIAISSDVRLRHYLYRKYGRKALTRLQQFVGKGRGQKPEEIFRRNATKRALASWRASILYCERMKGLIRWSIHTAYRRVLFEALTAWMQTFLANRMGRKERRDNGGLATVSQLVKSLKESHYHNECSDSSADSETGAIMKDLTFLQRQESHNFWQHCISEISDRATGTPSRRGTRSSVLHQILQESVRKDLEERGRIQLLAKQEEVSRIARVRSFLVPKPSSLDRRLLRRQRIEEESAALSVSDSEAVSVVDDISTVSEASSTLFGDRPDRGLRSQAIRGSHNKRRTEACAVKCMYENGESRDDTTTSPDSSGGRSLHLPAAAQHSQSAFDRLSTRYNQTRNRLERAERNDRAGFLMDSSFSISNLIQLLRAAPSKRLKRLHSTKKIQAWRWLMLCHKALDRLKSLMNNNARFRTLVERSTLTCKRRKMQSWKRAYEGRRRWETQQNYRIQLSFLRRVLEAWRRWCIRMRNELRALTVTVQRRGPLRRSWEAWAAAQRWQSLVHLADARGAKCIRLWLAQLLQQWKDAASLSRNMRRFANKFQLSRLKEAFAVLRDKVSIRKKLRRVFTLYTLAWDFRMYGGPSDFQRLVTTFAAWRDHAKESKKIRCRESSASTALLFRSVTLQARHFFAWSALLEDWKTKCCQAKCLYDQRCSMLLHRCLNAWKDDVISSMKESTRLIQTCIAKRWNNFVRNGFIRWGKVAQRRVRLSELLSSNRLELSKTRRSFEVWRRQFLRFKRLVQFGQRLQLHQLRRSLKKTFGAWRMVQSSYRRIHRGVQKLALITNLWKLRRAFLRWPGLMESRKAEALKRHFEARGRKRAQLVDAVSTKKHVEGEQKAGYSATASANLSQFRRRGGRKPSRQDENEIFFVRDDSEGDWVQSFLMRGPSKRSFRERMIQLAVTEGVPLSSLEALCQAVLYGWRQAVETSFRLKLCQRRAQWLVDKRRFARCWRIWMASTPSTAHRVLLWAQKHCQFLPKMSNEEAIEYIEIKRNSLPLLQCSGEC